MLKLKRWDEVKSKSSTIRDIYEKGGGIIFADKVLDKNFLTLAVCPFISKSFEDFTKATREARNPPPYLYIKDEKYISKFFFLKNFEEVILRKILNTEEFIFVSVPNLKISQKKIGIRLHRDKDINELIGILGGLALCIPISSQKLEMFNHRADIVLIGDENIQSNFPTFLECVDENSVRIFYEGSFSKYYVSEKLTQYGIKVT
ncbi:MAG: hypothetical protein NZ927_03990 [Candidatus Calescibacterium sp.]|nr:hypothetical protein [Candidatus Calescibacterium sp.]MCX7734283.1 hypothetical protein [bacterium]MDW8087114.1 hypothetical protein [Candidatus Calescibacterium sp.]